MTECNQPASRLPWAQTARIILLAIAVAAAAHTLLPLFNAVVIPAIAPAETIHHYASTIAQNPLNIPILLAALTFITGFVIAWIGHNVSIIYPRHLFEPMLIHEERRRAKPCDIHSVTNAVLVNVSYYNERAPYYFVTYFAKPLYHYRIRRDWTFLIRSCLIAAAVTGVVYALSPISTQWAILNLSTSDPGSPGGIAYLLAAHNIQIHVIAGAAVFAATFLINPVISIIGHSVSALTILYGTPTIFMVIIADANVEHNHRITGHVPDHPIPNASVPHPFDTPPRQLREDLRPQQWNP